MTGDLIAQSNGTPLPARDIWSGITVKGGLIAQSNGTGLWARDIGSGPTVKGDLIAQSTWHSTLSQEPLKNHGKRKKFSVKLISHTFADISWNHSNFLWTGITVLGLPSFGGLCWRGHLGLFSFCQLMIGSDNYNLIEPYDGSTM